MRNVRHILLILFLLDVLLMFSGCITEKECTTGHHLLRVALFDRNGKEVIDSTAQLYGVYKFVNGKYAGSLRRLPNGLYTYTANDCDNTDIVALKVHDSDSISVFEPQKGESLTSLWARLPRNEEGECVIESHKLWYGDFIYTQSSGEGESGILKMFNQMSSLRFSADNLDDDNEEYTVVISGLRDAVGYDGRACGDSVVYRPNISYGETSGSFTCDELFILPTAPDEHITIRVYRNGRLYRLVDRDDEGTLLTLNAGQDLKVRLNARDKHVTTSIHVADWRDADEHYTTQK